MSLFKTPLEILERSGLRSSGGEQALLAKVSRFPLRRLPRNLRSPQKEAASRCRAIIRRCHKRSAKFVTGVGSPAMERHTKAHPGSAALFPGQLPVVTKWSGSRRTVALETEPQNPEEPPGSDTTTGEDHRGQCTTRRTAHGWCREFLRSTDLNWEHHSSRSAFSITHLQFMGFILLMDAVRRSRVSNGLAMKIDTVPLKTSNSKWYKMIKKESNKEPSSQQTSRLESWKPGWGS